jgi:hypothetical protein
MMVFMSFERLINAGKGLRVAFSAHTIEECVWVTSVVKMNVWVTFELDGAFTTIFVRELGVELMLADLHKSIMFKTQVSLVETAPTLIVIINVYWPSFSEVTPFAIIRTLVARTELLKNAKLFGLTVKVGIIPGHPLFGE